MDRIYLEKIKAIPGDTGWQSSSGKAIFESSFEIMTKEWGMDKNKVLEQLDNLYWAASQECSERVGKDNLREGK